MENQCFGCGCTETKACTDDIEPCHWLVLDKELNLGVCSSCQDHTKAFEQHKLEMAKLAQELKVNVIETISVAKAAESFKKIISKLETS